MRVLGNSILGTIFSRYSLMLNDKGLYRKVKVDGQPSANIFITDNPKTICEILGIDFNRFDESNGEDAYIHIIGSETFPKNLFLNDRKSSNNVILFREFLGEFLENNTLDREYTPIDSDRVGDITGMDLKRKVEYYKFILNSKQEVAEKFNKMKSTLIDNGYDVKNFSTDIPNFMNSFESLFEYKRFLMESDLNTLLEEFGEHSKVLS